MRHPDQVKQYLKEDEFKVYKLIWQRFVASQITPAVFDQTTVDIDAKSGSRRVLVPRDRVGDEVRRLPQGLRRIEGRQGRRRRGTEAQTASARSRAEAHAEGAEAGAAFHRAASALQRSLAGQGTRRTRNRASINLFGDSEHDPGAPVRAEGRRQILAHGNWSGRHRSAGRKLPRHFRHRSTPRAWKKNSTRSKKARKTGTHALGDFYKKFEKDLRYAQKHMENIKRMEKPTDEKCERCGSPLVIKWGKHGSFYACSSYDKENPDTCTFTKENPINLPDLDSADVQETTQEEYCENCGRVMVLKRGRFGQFMACTGYPDCKTTRRLDQGKTRSRHSAR